MVGDHAALGVHSLAPHRVHDSVGELLRGAVRVSFEPPGARSGASFERVVVDGEPCVVKYTHPDRDFTSRALGDIGCVPRRVWEAGVVDAVDDVIDHAVVGAARWGRNGWGVALLMRDVTDDLLPADGAPITEAQQATFLDHLARLAARFWDWDDDVGLLPPASRWGLFSDAVLAGEAALGFPERAPRLAVEGWERFDRDAPADVAGVVAALRHDPAPLVDALASTPHTLLHGDWSFDNLGVARDGRTVLLDWAHAGTGPVAHELGWYLARNRRRLPAGLTEEDVVEDFVDALEWADVGTIGWWERQLDLCLLGTLVQFGWDKASAPRDELGWWCDRARAGAGQL